MNVANEIWECYDEGVYKKIDGDVFTQGDGNRKREKY